MPSASNSIISGIVFARIIPPEIKIITTENNKVIDMGLCCQVRDPVTGKDVWANKVVQTHPNNVLSWDNFVSSFYSSAATDAEFEVSVEAKSALSMVGVPGEQVNCIVQNGSALTHISDRARTDQKTVYDHTLTIKSTNFTSSGSIPLGIQSNRTRVWYGRTTSLAFSSVSNLNYAAGTNVGTQHSITIGALPNNAAVAVGEMVTQLNSGAKGVVTATAAAGATTLLVNSLNGINFTINAVADTLAITLANGSANVTAALSTLAAPAGFTGEAKAGKLVSALVNGTAYTTFDIEQYDGKIFAAGDKVYFADAAAGANPGEITLAGVQKTVTNLNPGFLNTDLTNAATTSISIESNRSTKYVDVGFAGNEPIRINNIASNIIVTAGPTPTSRSTVSVSGISILNDVVEAVVEDLGIPHEAWDSCSYINVVNQLQDAHSLGEILSGKATTACSLPLQSLIHEIASTFDEEQALPATSYDSAVGALYSVGVSESIEKALSKKTNGIPTNYADLKKYTHNLILSIMFKNSTPGVRNVEFRIHMYVNNALGGTDANGARTLKELCDHSKDFKKFVLDGREF